MIGIDMQPRDPALAAPLASTPYGRPAEARRGGHRRRLPLGTPLGLRRRQCRRARYWGHSRGWPGRARHILAGVADIFRSPGLQECLHFDIDVVLAFASVKNIFDLYFAQPHECS